MQLQELQELARLRRPVYGISKLPGCSTLDTADSALRWSQLKCTTGTVLADGHGKLGDILVGESSQATISPKLNPGLNSNLADANIGPQMLCPPPLLARLLLTSW